MIPRRMTKLLSWCGNMVPNGGRSLLSISRGGLVNSAVKGTVYIYPFIFTNEIIIVFLVAEQGTAIIYFEANNNAFSLPLVNLGYTTL